VGGIGLTDKVPGAAISRTLPFSAPSGRKAKSRDSCFRPVNGTWKQGWTRVRCRSLPGCRSNSVRFLRPGDLKEAHTVTRESSRHLVNACLKISAGMSNETDENQGGRSAPPFCHK
jgi:hypothetical protein